MGRYLVCKYNHKHTYLKMLLTCKASGELFSCQHNNFVLSAAPFRHETKKRLQVFIAATHCGQIGALPPARVLQNYGDSGK